jgi:hypothetical protein
VARVDDLSLEGWLIKRPISLEKRQLLWRWRRLSLVLGLCRLIGLNWMKREELMAVRVGESC